MTDDQTKQQDPKEHYPHPAFPEQEQEHPGLDSEMQPKPDYGYESYRGHGRLEGKATIITGGDSGIGRAVALAFAREGADVLISYLEEEESDAQETARVVEEAGKQAVKVPGDISEESHCRHVVERAVEEFGKVDVLVNNAAYQMTFDGVTEIPSDLLFVARVMGLLNGLSVTLGSQTNLLREMARILDAGFVPGTPPTAEAIAQRPARRLLEA